MKRLLADTYDIALATQACGTIAELNALVERYAAPWGVTRTLGGIVPTGYVPTKVQAGYIILGSWPAEWAHRYMQGQYVRDDPTILHARDCETPLYWRDLRADGSARRIMDEAAEYPGLRDGMTLPQYTVDGVKIGISFSGDQIDISTRARTALLFLSSLATARALEIAAITDERQHIRLTQRERECLLWMAGGKTDWETSTILGISEDIVERHIRSIRVKLGAATRPHAVAIALRLGILS